MGHWHCCIPSWVSGKQPAPRIGEVRIAASRSHAMLYNRGMGCGGGALTLH